MLRFLLSLVIAFLVVWGPASSTVLSSSGPQSPAQPAIWAIRDAPPQLKLAIATADTVIVAQHSALIRQLTRALSEGGTALAIRSCHLEATANANWVGRQRGWAIGRTSDRLRNPINRPPAWAVPIVQREADRTAAAVEGFVADLTDRVGVLRPIVMQPLCNGCHGAPDTIKDAVRAELADRYPTDRAVGFKNGEIRGWYWAEVPKSPAGK